MYCDNLDLECLKVIYDEELYVNNYSIEYFNSCFIYEGDFDEYFDVSYDK